MGKEYTEAQKRAIYKYQANKVKVTITIDKDQRERYHKLAADRGVSLTELIISLLESVK